MNKYAFPRIIGPLFMLLVGELAEAKTAPNDHVDTTNYDALLRKHVTNGLVDYGSLLTHRKILDNYVQSIADLSDSRLATASRPQKLAFYINAYNALTWKSVLDHYPIEQNTPKRLFGNLIAPKNSIRRIPGVWDKVQHTVAGQKLTLDDLEHRILRRDLGEPRVHFALVCAARSCPLLRPEAYTAAKVEEQLEDDVRRFVRNPNRLRIDRKSKKVFLSKIVKWYSADFSENTKDRSVQASISKSEKGVVAFLASYLPKQDADFLMQENYKISYFDYDWDLNDIAIR